LFEIIEGIFKGFALLLKLFVEGGFFDMSLSLTGRFFIKTVYPPHWFKKVSYNQTFERYIGAVVWVLFAYGAFLLDSTLQQYT
jgi:hypothetical protein